MLICTISRAICAICLLLLIAPSSFCADPSAPPSEYEIPASGPPVPAPASASSRGKTVQYTQPRVHTRPPAPSPSLLTSGTIFVSIASLMDSELVPTIADMLEKAAYPDRVNVTAFAQERAGTMAYRKQNPESAPFYNLANVHVREMDVAKALEQGMLGAGAARSYVQQYYSGEDFYMQLDSHHRFFEGWDVLLIQKLSSAADLRPVRGDNKTIITQYLNKYKPGKIEEMEKEFAAPPHRLTGKFFIDSLRVPNGTAKVDWDPVPLKVRVGPVPVNPSDKGLTLSGAKQPQPTAFLSGHFIFAHGRFVRDVPYDPEIPFDGEEDSMAIRAYTHGYDMFCLVDVNAAVHFYGRDGHPTAWHEYGQRWDALNARGIVRLRELLTSSDGFHHKDERKLHGLGTERSLAAYEEFSGVHYGLRVLGRRAKTGDPGYGRNWDNSNREFLFVSDNRELVWQNNVGSWWHMKNMTGGGDKAVTVFVEVTDPDWGGVSKTDQGSAGIKMSLGPNVLLYDPGSKKGRCQIRLSKKYAEERCITPFTKVGDKNSTRNGHKGWEKWSRLAEGTWF